MSRPFADVPFLRGNYAPWSLEGEAYDLPVVGEIPSALAGTLFRNGPNPQHTPRGRHHWFDGDGMVHAIRLHDGRVSYRNRWVRTARFALERAAGESLFGGLADVTAGDPRAAGTSLNPANTHVVWHGGKLLALCEAGLPHWLDPVTLETVGPWDFAGRLVGAMTAHPKFDPETGEMIFFGYSATPPFVRLHVADVRGRLLRSHPIDAPFPSMMHDVIVTKEHVVLLACPATLRLEHVARTGSIVGWEPDLGTQLGVMRRDGDGSDVRWIGTGPCYVFHALNAHSDGHHIVADVCRYDRVPLFDGDRAAGLEDLTAHLVRWTIDLTAGAVKEEPLDDLCVEFPRLDERRSGLAYHHGWAAGAAPTKSGERSWSAIVHWDLAHGTRRLHCLPHGDVAGEPIFVPTSPDAHEGEGFLLALAYRAREHRSDLLVLDAQQVDAEPLATVQLPHRIPFGFHGSFVPGV